MLGFGALSAISSIAVAQERAEVRVGVFHSISDAGIYVAKEKGYFAEENIDISLYKVGSAANVVTPLASEALDVSGGSPSAGLYNALRQGITLQIVADKASTPKGHGYVAYIVRKALAGKIRTTADLRGRVLAATGYNGGSTGQVNLHKLLSSAGVKESELDIVDLKFGDAYAALGTGRVDVAMLIEPLATKAVAQDVGVVWKRVDEIYPNEQYGVLMYGPGIIKRPDVANRFMAAYLRGVRYYNDALAGKIPAAELTKILIKNTSVKDPALYTQMVFPRLDPNGKLNVAGMEDDVEWWMSAGVIKGSVKVGRVVNTSYVENALKKLGLYH
jgi:NitT/TauT family transport system substrate-binding protein